MTKENSIARNSSRTERTATSIDQSSIERSVTNIDASSSSDSLTRYGGDQIKQPIPDATDEEQYAREFGRELSRVSTRLSRITSKEPSIHSESDGVDPSELEWDSADDPDRPMNWSNPRKWFITMSVAFMCLTVTLGSSVYVCAVPEMMAKWHISQTKALLGLTFYILGLAFGPSISAPLSEMFGRKIVYLGSLPTAIPLTVGVALSKNIGTLVPLRFLAGLCSSGALAVAGGSLKDMWSNQEIALAMTTFALAPMMGPVLGPIIGGFVAQNKVSPDPNVVGGLRWTMWVDLMFYAAVSIPLLIAPETYKPIILTKRAEKRGTKVRKQGNLLSLLVTVMIVTLLKPIDMLRVEPIVLAFSIYTAFIFSVLFGFFEAFPIIFRGVYKMELGVSGLAFLGVGVGLVLGGTVFVLFNNLYVYKQWPDGYVGMKDKQGNPVQPTPESSLFACKVGSCTLAPSLFWLAWSSKESVHWMCPITSGVLFGFSLIMIFMSVMMYFGMVYPPMSMASALAANNILRYVMACSFPLFTSQMITKLHINWGVSVFAFIALALSPVPWIFTMIGPKLRKISKYGYAAMAKKQEEEKAQEV